MESEKVKEIKNALEHNAKSGIGYDSGEKFCDIWFVDILTYINELEEENEHLNKINNEKRFKDLAEVKEIMENNKKLKDRIAELERENERLNKLFTYDKSVSDRCFEFIKDIKVEALKQFAEKVKTKIKELKQRYHEDCINGLGDEEYNGITENNVDEILKEC